MRGPFLSGALGSAASLSAILRWVRGPAGAKAASRVPGVQGIGGVETGEAVKKGPDGTGGADGVARVDTPGDPVGPPVGPAGPVVVLGPLWLGVTLAAELRVVMLVATDDHAAVKRARRRAHKAGRAFEIAVGGAEVPLRPRSVGAMIVENVAGLDAAAARAWIEALVPGLRPGGRLIAVDATSDVAAMARVSGTFLSASLVGLTQEQPRDGVVLTVGEAPDARVMTARFAAPASDPLRASP